MQKRFWLLSLLILMLIAACGPAIPSEKTPTEPSERTLDMPVDLPTKSVEQNFTTDPTHTPPAMPDAYPAAPITQPPAESSEGYPAAPVVPTLAPNPEAYPAEDGFVWIIRPLGEQCADPDPTNPTDLSEAKAALTAAGLSVGEAEMTNLIVCTACGCPTSAHFRIQVSARNVSAAESLGWKQE